LNSIVDGISGKVVALGPLDVPSPSKAFAHCLQIVLKSADHRQLRDAAKKISAELQRNRKIRLTVDVDPLKI